MHGADFYEYLPDPGVPVLVTLHLPVERYPETIFHLDRPQTFFQCVNVQQRDACPPCPYLLPEIGSTVSGEPPEAAHGARFLDAGAIDKYFSIYERLVGDARALEELSHGFSEPRLAVDIIHA
jgi:hypothetical protein